MSENYLWLCEYDVCKWMKSIKEKQKQTLFKSKNIKAVGSFLGFPGF